MELEKIISLAFFTLGALLLFFGMFTDKWITGVLGVLVMSMMYNHLQEKR